MMKPIAVIGDVHSCLLELQELVTSLRSYGVEELRCVGDLCDRGPQPRETIEFCVKNNILCVTGNHCSKMLRYYEHEKTRLLTGKQNPIQATEERKAEWDSIPEEHRDWMRANPYYRRLGDWGVVVHAGFRPGIPIEKQNPKEIQRIRYLDKDKGTFATDRRGPQVQPQDSVRWFELWDGPEWIIAGHHVTDGLEPEIYDCPGGAKVFSIDQGCVYGGALTAVVFEPVEGQKYPNYRFLQVRAKRKYYDARKTKD